MKKKWVTVCLICTLVISLAVPSRQMAAEERVPSVDEAIIDLGTPIQTAQTIDAAYGQEDGTNVVYTTVTGSASSGDWARFNVIDIDNERLLRSFPLEGTSNAWSHVVTKDGRVFIGASKKMFVYSADTKEVTDLGIPIAGTDSIWSLTSDETGNVYGGIYSASVGGRVFKIDHQTLEITDVLGGRVDESENYIRSIAYYGGHIYAGTGSTNGRVWKIDTENGVKERIEIPGAPEDPIYQGKYHNMGFVYGMTVVDHYLFAFFNGPSAMLVYDLEKRQWKEKGLENIRGLMAVTGQRDGKVYTSKKDGNMWEIDIATLEERVAMRFDGSIRNSKWMDVKNQPEFPQGAMVTISYDGKVVLYDPSTQKSKAMRALVDGQATNLQAIEAGPDGKIYISSYMGTDGAIYDPAKGDELTTFPLGQAEGFGRVEDTLYFGVYPKAEIHGYDTNEEMPASGPGKLFAIGNEQDRPFVLRVGGGKLLIGTIPGYSMHGGALTIYDPEASKASGIPAVEVYRNIVENQSIAGLAYKDGIIYGSTTIHGGLGADPIATKAKLFSFDMDKKTKLAEWDLDLPGLSSTVPMISGLTAGPDGLIWGVANGFVFAFNPDTKDIVKSTNVYPEVTNFGKWRPVKMYWGADGLLYTNVADRLTVLHPETMESKLLVNQTSIFTLNEENDIYFAQATRVKKRMAERPAHLSLDVRPTLTVNEPAPLNAIAGMFGWDVDVTNQADFQLSDPELARIEDGNIIPLQAGDLAITFTYMGKTSSPQHVNINDGGPRKVKVKLQNPGFEQVDEDGRINGWSLRKGKPNTFSSTEMAYEGERSLRLINEKTRGKTEFQSEKLVVKPGKEYTAGAQIWINGKHQKPMKADRDQLLQIQFYDKNDREIKVKDKRKDKLTVPMEEWFKAEITSVAPKNTTYARIILNGFFGWIENEYYDDVTLYTSFDADEWPTAELLSINQRDFAEGSDLTLLVKADQGSQVEVLEGEAVVASGEGKGETPIELVIPKLAAGTHQYRIEVSLPGYEAVTSLDVPEIAVHSLTDLKLDRESLLLTTGDFHAFTGTAIYGPVSEDVSKEIMVSSSHPDIVEVEGNKVTALSEGEAKIYIQYGHVEKEMKVVVSNDQLQSLELNLPESELAVGASMTATVIAVYHNEVDGRTKKVDVSSEAHLSTNQENTVKIEGVVMRADAPGTAAITASYGGKKVEAILTVVEAVDDGKVYLPLENGDFESEATGSIPGWSIRNEKAGYATIEVTAEQASSGSRSLKLVDATTSNHAAIQSALIAVEPGTEYTAGVKVFLGSPPTNPDNGLPFSSSRTLFQIRYYDENKTEINLTKGLGTTIEAPLGRWLQAEINSKAPEDARYVRLILTSSNAWVTTAYYDDAYVYRQKMAQ